MDCQDARLDLLAHQQGRLPLERHEAVTAHLDTCADCAHADAAEQELTRALEQRLPQHPASVALKRRLAARWERHARARQGWPWRRLLVPALVAALLVAVALPLLTRPARPPLMVAEAVNDHLRIVQAQRPLEVESGGIHRVKPWFDGRLDFAPEVAGVDDPEFPLQGGAVGYFVDRRAAVLVYRRRLHPVSLFVFRAEGLPWPGRAALDAHANRGFNVILWRRGDLGYALVSDVDPRELETLAGRLAASP
jgi:anti-sigma factor RsiW